MADPPPSSEGVTLLVPALMVVWSPARRLPLPFNRPAAKASLGVVIFNHWRPLVSKICKSLKHLAEGPDPPNRKMRSRTWVKVIPARGDGGRPPMRGALQRIVVAHVWTEWSIGNKS